MKLFAEALRRLGIERFACAVHDRCLPRDGDFDLGCGAPGADASADFLAFLEELGFDAVQLGPPGQVSLHNLSPYDGTAFSRSPLQLSWSAVVESGLLTREELLDPAPPDANRDGRCDYPRAFQESSRRWALLHRRLEALEASGDARLGPFTARQQEFRAREAGWLATDGLHRLLSERFGTTDAHRWPGLQRPSPADLSALQAQHGAELLRFEREQGLLLEQHFAFRARARSLGLLLLGDLQAGLSHADRWAHRDALLEGFSMGAPPSRTNPLGQPWGYPVLDPARQARARALLEARYRKLFREYDGVRVDHPHALVCPWVYRANAADPYQAVRAGARLYSVGPRAELPELAAFDIARAGQLDAREKPWADRFVTSLEPEQVEHYAWAMDALVAAARASGEGARAVACEVLSTLPYPLGRVLERHGLGRFRVTGKADVTKSDDVYLPEAAREEDWVMTGTHDTPPLWHTARAWSEPVAAARRAHAAARLSPDGVGREELLRHLSSSREALAQAEQALLFTSRARQVMVWWSDLLGEARLYNRPGEVHPENWTLRVPSDFRAVQAERASRRAAFDPAAALALALAARPLEQRMADAPLIGALAAQARAPLPDLSARLTR